MYRLYDLELSGNAYKARLFLSLIDADCDIVPVNVMGGEHKQPEFLALNPKGQVPVLRDGTTVIYDSQAILVYLAEKETGHDYYPADPVTRGHIQTWLATAANEIARGPADARLVKLFGMSLDYDHALAVSTAILPVLEAALTGRDWLVTDHATIADIAVFPYVALSGDAEISLELYPAIRGWIERIKELPGFVGMPGIEAPATV